MPPIQEPPRTQAPVGTIGIATLRGVIGVAGGDWIAPVAPGPINSIDIPRSSFQIPSNAFILGAWWTPFGQVPAQNFLSTISVYPSGANIKLDLLAAAGANAQMEVRLYAIFAF